MDPKEFNRHIFGVKKELRDLRASIHAVIGYGEDAETELNRLENKLEELEKEVRAWQEKVLNDER